MAGRVRGGPGWGSRTKHPMYRVWCRMLERCRDKKRHNAKHYEHVEVCARWAESFEAFVEDMPPKPGPEFTLDRIDGLRGYEPGNVRWATAKQQAENRKSTKWYVIDGERLSESEMCRRRGLDKCTFRSRLARGWSFEEALCGRAS